MVRGLKPADRFYPDAVVEFIAVASFFLYLSNDGHPFHHFAECSKPEPVFRSFPPGIEHALIADADEKLAAGGSRFQPCHRNCACLVRKPRLPRAFVGDTG